MPTPTLDQLARQHFPHLSPDEARLALCRLLDDLDNQTLREARIEQCALQRQK